MAGLDCSTVTGSLFLKMASNAKGAVTALLINTPPLAELEHFNVPHVHKIYVLALCCRLHISYSN